MGLKRAPLEFIYKKRLYIFVFLISALMLFISYAIFGVYPFGDGSVLVLDLNGQYVYYFENLRDVFYGRGSFLNSWSRNFTGEMIGIYAYYLASPFTLIPMLFPRAAMTEALLIMQLFKVGSAAVTFCYYLKASHKRAPFSAAAFSVLYSLMSYMIVQLMNPMWLDALIYLPLICLGIEKIADKQKMSLFTVTLGLMFMANFYIGWMVAIFSVLYFLTYYFLLSESSYPLKIKKLIFSGLKFAGGGLLAGAVSSWLLLPTYHSLKLGKFDFSSPNFKMRTQFDFADFFIQLLPNTYDTCRPEGSPVVYCGILTIMLIPLYFMNEKIKKRRKIGFGILSLVIILSMYIAPADIVWHGLQVPNWLPYRYSFILSFLMLIMAASAFDSLEGITLKETGAVFFGLSAYALYIDKQGYENIDILATTWYTIIFAFSYMLILQEIKKRGKGVKALPLVMMTFIAAELIISSAYTFLLIDDDVSYSRHSSYNRYITLGRNTISGIKEKDPSPVYRIEKNFERTVNDNMAFGSFGLSHSSSTLNKAPIQFLRRLGFSYGGHYIKYRGATYITDAVFGIKYVMEKGAVKDKDNPDAPPKIALSKHYNDGLRLINGDDTEIFYVYENPYALPVAFMADNAILDLYLTGENPFISQNKLLSSLISDERVEYFKKIEVDDIVPENARMSDYGNHSKYVPRIEGENSHIEFLFTAPTDDMIYAYFPSLYERQINLWLNKEFLNYYYESGKMTIETLGRYDPGEQISLIATITDKNEVLFQDQYFYYLDEALFIEAIDKLKQSPLEATHFEEDHIKGGVKAEKDGVLFTTISWEPGWTILVDGEKTEPVKIAEALIGIPLEAGEHTVEMKFFPKGLTEGLMLSGLGLIIIILIIIYERRQDKVILGRLI